MQKPLITLKKDFHTLKHTNQNTHKMHAKTDSDSTSFSPPSSDHNRRPVYYVQSPSRDSHDGGKTTTSFHSTPVLGSPVGSPPHSQSSIGRHSRESSTSRFSGSLKPGSRKISPNDVGSGGGRGHRKGGVQKNWNEFDVIEEERLLGDDESRKRLPRRCYFLIFVGGFFVLFSLFALILLAASKPQKPTILMRSIKFERFAIQAGSDNTGVSTDMLSTNATVKFTFTNTATFFGLHVSSTPLALYYSQLTIASGDVKNFYESRKNSTNVSVIVVGDKIPMYGSGATLSTHLGLTTLPVPLKLEFTVRSRAYVLGKLVKPKFYKKVNCSIVFESNKLNTPISLKKSCTYDT